MRKFGLAAIAVLFALVLAPVASAQQGKGTAPTHGCDQALENDGDPYDSTCDGSASQNGKGDGNATGKPCAGCVGAADNKNPKGQLPDGSDHNKGYECDENQGIGKTNPAHTGCDAYTNRAPAIEPQTIEGSSAHAFDPTTGTSESSSAPWWLVVAAMAIALTIGTFLRRRTSKRSIDS